MDEGHQVAITTFSAYPDSIKIILQQLGLNQDQINRIPIIGGFPTRGHNDPNRKMEHIEKAKALTDINCNSNVILVDDSKDNIKAAAENGVNVVHVEGPNCWTKVKNKVKNLVTSLEAQRHDQVPTTSRNEDDQKTAKKQIGGDTLSNLWEATEFITLL